MSSVSRLKRRPHGRLALLGGAATIAAVLGLAVAQGVPENTPPGDATVPAEAPAADDLDALFEQLNAEPSDDAALPAGEDAALGTPEWGQESLLSDPFAGQDDVIVEPKPGVMIPREAFQARSGAVLRGLDKITGRFTDIPVKTGKAITFGSLEITLQACYDTPPDVLPESAAFLKIRSKKALAPESLPPALAAKFAALPVDSEARLQPELFSGWMFASSPGLNALEHPVYDVWVMSCSAS
jgi:hypothetical protein